MPQRTFMSVDISNSTLLKHGASERDVQKTFKHYQDFIRSKIRDKDGRIISITGDETMAEFESAEKGALSALSIQKNLSEFNQNDNKLFQDFRVRIGLATGQVQDEEVTEQTANIVIDTAATIQKDGMPGRIFVSNSTHEELDALKDQFEYHEYHKALDIEIYRDRKSTDWEDAHAFRNDHYDHGYNLLKKNRFGEAEEYFRKALTHAREADNSRWIASCLHALSYALGRQRRNEEKIKLCQQQLELQEEIGDERAIELVHYDLFFGYYWMARDEERKGNFDEALDLYGKALESAKQSGNPSIEKRAHRNLKDLEIFLEEHSPQPR